jgi:class 3 adenylate cyclase
MGETGEHAVDRRLTAVLATDLVGYSRLMGKDEVGTLARLNRLRREVIDPTIAACRGRIVKTTGDGLLVAFASIVDATRCAILIQRDLGARNAGLGADDAMRFRVGVNIGDVILSGDDIFGDCVNIAARLEALAEPGGICISKAAHDQVRGKVQAEFADSGAHAVKNIARPVETFALSAEAIAAIPADALGRDRPVQRKPRRLALAGAALGLLIAAVSGAAYWYQAQRPPETFETRLAAALGRLLPDLPSKARERAVADYLAGPRVRAFALAPGAHSRRWSADWPSRDSAIEKVLERCQISFNEPCALLAVDEEMIAPGRDGTLAVSDMPRTHYAGSFDPEQIPAMRAGVAKRPDVLGYAAVTGPKAAALHVDGVFTTMTTAQTQRGAEFQALKACNDDPASHRSEGATRAPCVLYAIGNSVVLPQRANAPLTPR